MQVPALRLAGLRPSSQGSKFLGARPPEEERCQASSSFMGCSSRELVGRWDSSSLRSSDGSGVPRAAVDTVGPLEPAELRAPKLGQRGRAVVPKLSFTSLRASPRGLRMSPAGAPPRPSPLSSPGATIHEEPAPGHEIMSSSSSLYAHGEVDELQACTSCRGSCGCTASTRSAASVQSASDGGSSCSQTSSACLDHLGGSSTSRSSAALSWSVPKLELSRIRSSLQGCSVVGAPPPEEWTQWRRSSRHRSSRARGGAVGTAGPSDIARSSGGSAGGCEAAAPSTEVAKELGEQLGEPLLQRGGDAPSLSLEVVPRFWERLRCCKRRQRAGPAASGSGYLS